MKSNHLILLAGIGFLFAACESKSISVTIFADNQTYRLTSPERVPGEILSEAGISIEPADRVLYLGSPIPLEAALLDSDNITLDVRRAQTLVVHTEDGESNSIETSAQTIGEALVEAGLNLYAADRLDPPAETPIIGDLDVFWQPASELTITLDESQVKIRSAAPTVGQALAEAGLPLIGLDYSLPSESNPLPADGQIRIVRVVESVALTQKSIPFGTRTELTADLEIDQQALVQGGEEGLAITRLRTRTEDGLQVSQVSETESVVRLPQDQILGIGTKIVIRTATVDGVTIEYWRSLTLFSTYYKPCIPGTTLCYYGTASGTRVRKGAVAMVYPWYLLFAGERLYVPGYGFATVEDNNGAWTTSYGTYWIDLGYSETDVLDWVNQYVTVYFLTPVPANAADTYLLP